MKNFPTNFFLFSCLICKWFDFLGDCYFIRISIDIVWFKYFFQHLFSGKFSKFFLAFLLWKLVFISILLCNHSSQSATILHQFLIIEMLMFLQSGSSNLLFEVLLWSYNLSPFSLYPISFPLCLCSFYIYVFSFFRVNFNLHFDWGCLECFWLFHARTFIQTFLHSSFGGSFSLIWNCIKFCKYLQI